MPLSLPEVPKEVRSYIWVLVGFAAFALIQNLATRLAVPQPVPPPPVVVTQNADGSVSVLNYSPAK